jgi:hypothetical protein
LHIWFIRASFTYFKYYNVISNEEKFHFSYSNTALSLRNNRFRRDQRALEEEEEMWFDQEDDVDDGENIVPMSDMLKSKLDDFDQIDKFIGNRRGKLVN